MAPQGAKSSGCKTPTPAGGEAVILPIIPETGGEPLKRELYVLRGDVKRLGATDGCTACTNLILGNRATVTHDECKICKEKDGVRRVRLERRWVRQPEKMVVGQPLAGVRASHESEERAGNRLRSIAAGTAAPSIEVCNETMQVEVGSRTRAADTAIEDIDPRMEGSEGAADDDVTIAVDM